MYKLNSKSNGAKFFEWLWNTDVKQFKTMCPYFWAYVGTILILPVMLTLKLVYFFFPAKKAVLKVTDYIASSKFGDAWGNAANYIAHKHTFWNVVGKIIKWLFFSIIGAGLLWVLWGFVYKFLLFPIEGLAVIGAFSIALGLLALGVYIFTTTNLGRVLGTPFRLFGNMIHSLYKGFCPLVNWD